LRAFFVRVIGFAGGQAAHMAPALCSHGIVSALLPEGAIVTR
jgi:hypothetical protein